MAGDRVLLNGDQGEIDFVADPADDPENWYLKESEGGVMAAEPRVFGSLFLRAPLSGYEELEFV